MKTDNRKPWSIVIEPTQNGKGYQIDVLAKADTPNLEPLVDLIGNVLAVAPVKYAHRDRDERPTREQPPGNAG